MSRQAVLFLNMLVFPLLGGCEGDITPELERREPIQTDATLYALREDGVGLATEIPFRWENQAAFEALDIVNCLGGLTTVLEKKVAGGWEEFWSPVLRSCESPPIVIVPGGVLVDTLHLWGALPGHNTLPDFKSDDVEGVYRIVMHNVVFRYEDRQLGFGDDVPLEYRVSNSFVLDDPRR